MIAPTDRKSTIICWGDLKFAKQTSWLAVWSSAMKIKWGVEDIAPYR